MKKVEYVCKKCGFAKEYTKKQKIIKAISSMFFSLIMTLGIFTLLLMIYISPASMFDMVGSRVISDGLYKSDYSELRQIGLNFTQDCREHDYNSDSYCYGVALFKNLKDIDYVPASFYNPIQDYNETLTTGGDCKSSSRLMTNMMKSLGFHAEVVCNLKERHCVTVLPHYIGTKYLQEYAVIDLTVPEFYGMQQGDNPWDYLEIGQRLK